MREVLIPPDVHSVKELSMKGKEDMISRRIIIERPIRSVANITNRVT